MRHRIAINVTSCAEPMAQITIQTHAARPMNICLFFLLWLWRLRHTTASNDTSCTEPLAQITSETRMARPEKTIVAEGTETNEKAKTEHHHRIHLKIGFSNEKVKSAKKQLF